MPKISIVIPVYNMHEHLEACLDSAASQTLADIEIICVDDCSTDDAPSVVRRYADRDARFRVITHAENMSVSQSRKDGVAAAGGEYIMFLDADDALEPDACERLYASMRAEPVDILHFGTTVVSESSLPPERVDWVRNFIRPHDGTLEGASILDGAFSAERLYNFTLWDKLYSAELCKKSFARVKDGPLPRGEDKYAYFILSYFARTYRGVPGECFYRYHYGRGVTGHAQVSLSEFTASCAMGRAANLIREFLLEEDALADHAEIYANARDELLRHTVTNWSLHLGAEDRAAGFDAMLRHWGAAEVAGKIAELNWKDRGHIARLLRGSEAIDRRPTQARVIGTYYHDYANGGVQRIMSTSIALWRKLGYDVVLLTDSPPSGDDYELPEGVSRVVIPSFFEVDERSFVQRARALEQAVVDHHIDVMVYHAWLAPVLMWDLLVYKPLGVAVITHCHSVFSQPTRNAWNYFSELPAIYHLCDAIMVLSEVDRAYWATFNEDVVVVANPLTYKPDSVAPAALATHNVLWLGRIAPEKRPHEAIQIFAKIRADVPDATFTMVGTTSDEPYLASIRTLIDDLDLGDSVTMSGYHTDVLPFYKDSSVFLLTSEYEGFSMTLAESQSAGVPVVMYELPYLSLTREGRGLISVELGDVDGAADAAIALLRDADYRVSLGRDARANVEAVARFDFAGVWRATFERATATRQRRSPACAELTMWETLLAHYRIGADRRNYDEGNMRYRLLTANPRLEQAEQERRRARSALKKARSSREYVLGQKVLDAPHRLRAALGRLLRVRGS